MLNLYYGNKYYKFFQFDILEKFVKTQAVSSVSDLLRAQRDNLSNQFEIKTI